MQTYASSMSSLQLIDLIILQFDKISVEQQGQNSIPELSIDLSIFTPNKYRHGNVEECADIMSCMRSGRIQRI